MCLWWDQMGADPADNSNCVFNLGDNPDKYLTWSSSGRIPAFRRSAGRLWSPKYRRWLTPKDTPLLCFLVIQYM